MNGAGDARKMGRTGIEGRATPPPPRQPIVHPTADVLALWPSRLDLEQTGNSSGHSSGDRDVECPVYRRQFSEASLSLFLPLSRASHPGLRPWAVPTTHSIPNDGNEFPRVSRARPGIRPSPPLVPVVTFNRSPGGGCFRPSAKATCARKWFSRSVPRRT